MAESVFHFELPAPSDANPPAITTARACRDWLSVQPLANPAHAQAVLLRQVNLLNRYQLAPAERLKILELVRDPVVYAQTESARKFAGRPLPFSPSEQDALDANRQLWRALQVGYWHCLDACLNRDGSMAPHAALIVQRAMAALRGELLDIYRAAQEPPNPIWQSLHRLYACAEELGVADKPLSDSTQSSHPGTSIQAIYGHTLLTHHASPYELTSRQLQLVERWMHRWSNKITILDHEPRTEKPRFFVADLDSDSPGGIRAEGMARPRWLELSPLAGSIKRRIVKLKQGESPASLKLGDDFPAGACENLLKHLYRYWFKNGSARAHTRHTSNASCVVAAGMAAIHYYVSGGPFRQPGRAVLMSKKEADEIAVFGRLAARDENGFSLANGFMLEHWRVMDESASGVRLGRPLEQEGARVGSGHLLAVRLGESPDFLLAMARWVRTTTTGELHTGIRIFPGVPEPIALRGTGLASVSERFQQGFILPATPALHQPETVIAPAGWFRAARVIEVYQEGARKLQFTRLVDRGGDFERVAFERVG